MAEVRCPMCGRPNPADIQTCRYCRAQLKEKSSADENIIPSENSNDSDWLGQLRATSASEPNETLNSAISHEDLDNPDDEEIPEWLKRVRERNEIENPADDSTDDLFAFAEEETPASKTEALDDWLNTLETDSADQSSSPVSEEKEDWIDHLRISSIPAESSPQSQTEDEEWLKKLTSFSEPVSAEGSVPLDETDARIPLPNWTSGDKPEDSSSIEPSAEQETPDWLSKLPVDPNSSNEAPDWMKLMDEDSSSQSDDSEKDHLGWRENFQDEPSEFGSENETPEWLSGAGSAVPLSGQPESSAFEKPEWLKSFEKQPPDESPANATGTPEWLKSFEEQPAAEKPMENEESLDWSVPSKEEVLSSNDETIVSSQTPDWLKEFDQSVTDEKLEPEKKLDWLSEFREEESSATPADQAEILNVQNTPDWLKEFDEKAQEPSSAFSGQDEDWLKAFQDEARPTEAGVFPAEFSLSPDNQSPEQPDLPRWEESDSEKQPALLRDEVFKTSPFDEIPSDWLQDSQSTSQIYEGENAPAFVFENAAEESSKAEAGSPFVNEDLPDWLEEELESKPAAQLENGVNGDELAPAELPGWVEAMRPVEDVMPENSAVIDDRIVESVGPLAGLQGVLPAEKMALRYRKPPIYSAKLRVSEKQQAHALLLENLLTDESALQPVQSEDHNLPQKLVRIAVGLILIAVLLIPLLFGANAAIPTGLATTNEKQVYDTITSLPADSPILVAVDYEAGYAGEMRFTAVSLIEQLIARGFRITTVSTLPAGPLLAQNLIDTSLANLQKYDPQAAQAYSLSAQTANLGYLAGGVASLQEFSLNPKQAAYYGLDAKANGQSVWNLSALQGVNSLSDFGAIIVVTDRVETGRGWIEQVGLSLSGSKLLLVTSAQAGPLLQPYIKSEQAGGMISGMLGGTAYEQLANLPGNGPAYWRAYQSGLYTVIIVMIVGGLLNLLSFVVARRKDQS